MRSFIFVTSEGFTFQPNSESVTPDVENLQVIGFAQGENAETAFRQLSADNPWLQQTTFRKVQSIELAHLDYQSAMKTFYIEQAQIENAK